MSDERNPGEPDTQTPPDTTDKSYSDIRWCSSCQSRVESDRWLLMKKNGVCVQMCHRHGQE